MFYLFVLGKALALIFPRSLCYFIAKIIAILHYWRSPQDRETVTYNLSPLIRDAGELKRSVRQVFINFSYYLVDFFRYSKIKESFIKKYVTISGLEYLKDSLARGKGVIALSAHLGNYELGGAVVALLGYPFYAVALPHKDIRINRFFDRQRQRLGVKVIPTGVFIKRCLRILRGDNIIGLVGDRDFSGGGLRVKVFYQEAILPRGEAFFALKTGADIIPSFFIRKNKKHYHFIFEKPITYNSKDSSAAEGEIIEKYAYFLKKYIKKYPCQWYMFERFWLDRT